MTPEEEAIAQFEFDFAPFRKGYSRFLLGLAVLLVGSTVLFPAGAWAWANLELGWHGIANWAASDPAGYVLTRTAVALAFWYMVIRIFHITDVKHYPKSLLWRNIGIGHLLGMTWLLLFCAGNLWVDLSQTFAVEGAYVYALRFWSGFSTLLTCSPFMLLIAAFLAACD